MAIADSQGTTFTFNAIAFLATNVKVMSSVNEIDASTLDLASGSMRAYQPAPLKDGDTVSCQYFGTQRPAMDKNYAIACAKLGISGNALCTKWENEAKVGELLTGSAEFRLSGGTTRDDGTDATDGTDTTTP
jgi:hypothetical protein